MSGTYDFGMVGLGTMGANFALNVADHGYSVLGLARSQDKADAFSALAEGRNLQGISDPMAFLAELEKPRIVMTLVPAGDPVDEVIRQLSPFMEPGDFFIEGGNSHFRDTARRAAELAKSGLGFIGVGVSGGEKGARTGPSIMAGGPRADYDRVRPILEAVSAKFNGEPCVDLLGKGAAGHYVKMVHNGIEYALMQLIAEAYDLLHREIRLGNDSIADLFVQWTDGPFGGFLTQITADVLKVVDPETENYLVDLVLDKAKQKGTGKWTSQDALDLGIPIPIIDAAVSARQLSGLKEERVRMESLLGSPKKAEPISAQDAQGVADEVRRALHAAFAAAYAQGFSLLEAASSEHGMEIDLQRCASVWRAGCIIRSKLLEPLRFGISQKAAGESVLSSPELAEVVRQNGDSLRYLVNRAVLGGIPVPCFSATLAYLDGYSTGRLPANLTQAQRDYFGAHTYERTDRPGTFHTDWGPN